MVSISTASPAAKSGPRKVCGHCGTDAVDLKACGSCKAAYYCDAKCQKSDWKSHKPMVCRYLKSLTIAKVTDSEMQCRPKGPVKNPNVEPSGAPIHITKEPRLVAAAEAWVRLHDSALRKYAIQLSEILPLKPGFNRPKYHTIINLCEVLFPGDLLIMGSMRVTLAKYQEMTPTHSKARDEQHYKHAEFNLGCRGAAPYTVTCGVTIMPYVAYASEKECNEMQVENSWKWNPVTCPDYLEKLLTEESGGTRTMWSAIVTLPKPTTK